MIQNSEVYPFHEGLALIRGKLWFGYINKEGKVVIPIEYDLGSHFHEGFASVKKGCYWAFINSNGQLITPFRYEAVGDFLGGLASIYLAGRTGYLTHEGTERWDCYSACGSLGFSS
jgi:hypothetical protein